MKRIILSFDGTWNKPGEGAEEEQVETNVCRLHEIISKRDAQGVRQSAHYNPGVGSNNGFLWWEKLSGGVFGHGLTQNILAGYQKLAEEYDEGDQIFLFGFSRGAYTARSLGGMIRKCGVLKRSHASKKLLDEAYKLYRVRKGDADTARAEKFKEAHSYDAKIWFIGVWDTVGALGIPIPALDSLNEGYKFHDTELSGIVKHAYHAISIDEFRADYKPALWDAIPKPDQSVEQRWFVGAHSDVGGGYDRRNLSDIALRWMQRRAIAAGLALEEAKMPKEADALDSPRDSYAEFLDGHYKKLHDPHYRPMGEGKAAATQSLDPTVAKRHAAGLYRPRNRGFKKMLDAH